METNEKDTLVMKLLHYFITEKNYNPVILQGAENEIWLENMKENYKIVRIVSGYIHNDEQLNFDFFKAKRIAKSIKQKTFSFGISILSIYTNLGDNVHLRSDRKITAIDLTKEDSLKNLDVLKEDFPDIRKKLKFTEEGMDLFIKITGDINKKNQTDAEHVNRTFEKKVPYLTYALIFLNCLVYFGGILFGTYESLLNQFCLYGPLVRLGEYYRLFTCMFLHADIIHLLFNCYALFIIGSQIESYLGRGKFIVIYFFSGILGSLLSITLSEYASIGASGAIFGLMGSLLYFGYHYRLYLGSVLRSQIIPLILFNLMYGFLVPGIDNAAHVGGLLGGILMTSALGVRYKSSKTEQTNGIIITTIFTLFLCYMAFFVAK